jgi:hypothetical protein
VPAAGFQHAIRVVYGRPPERDRFHPVVDF